jgi:hypothetical protein
MIKAIKNNRNIIIVGTLLVLFLLILFIDKKIDILSAYDNKNDFLIKNGVLITYTSNKAEVVVPDSVVEIATSAFEDGKNGAKDKIRTIIVPGSVKKIDSQAFAFCYAKKIIFKEGVEEIGDYAFMDSYPTEIYFPSSIKKVGVNILGTEEGLRNTKIYVVKDSKIEEIIRQQDPYGSYEIIYYDEDTIEIIK